MASLISRLAKAEGVSIGVGHKLPVENMDVWLIKLRAERKFERTIRLYCYLAERFLKQTPSPTRADIREYLVRRIEETSPSFFPPATPPVWSAFTIEAIDTIDSEGHWAHGIGVLSLPTTYDATYTTDGCS